MTHQKCWFHDHRKSLSGTRGSTRFLGCKPSHSWSVHHSGSLRTGLGRCHRHRSGMDLVSRCPCLCTPGRPLCSSRHLLEQTVDVLSLRHFFLLFVIAYEQEKQPHFHVGPWKLAVNNTYVRVSLFWVNGGLSQFQPVPPVSDWLKHQ